MRIFTGRSCYTAGGILTVQNILDTAGNSHLVANIAAFDALFFSAFFLDIQCIFPSIKAFDPCFCFIRSQSAYTYAIDLGAGYQL